MSISMFQSYLIIGNEITRRRETIGLAQKCKVNLKFISPDIFIIAPQNQSISINQVRDLKRHIFEKPVSSKYKFVIIEDAQKLTHEAQNALLKILEEPPSSAIIVLEAKNKQAFLPTILSRVIIKRAKQLKVRSSSDLATFEKKDLLSTLETITQVKDPTGWIDEQIQLFYKQLLKNLQGQNPKLSVNHLAKMIEKSVKAKIMIEANVDSKFALASLIFSLKSFDYPKLK